MSPEQVRDFPLLREDMVADIRRRGIRDDRILAAFRHVHREDFVPESVREYAYNDCPLPIGLNQTISQPYIVAYMINLAQIQPASHVLEIGTGSGYAAAIMAELAGEVFTIERQPQLYETSRRRLQELGYRNTRVRLGDGTQGWPDEAPFDAILVAAGSNHIPRAFLSQLNIDGRLIIPIGHSGAGQELLRVIRLGPDRYESKGCGSVSFVALISNHENQN
jgi:protein-L-isoaspartate(D-aspartate) O-methyltransferase